MQRKVILLFGGESQERFVSVATAQNLSRFLPQAKCWFWSPTDHIYEVDSATLQQHKDPFNKALEIRSEPLFGTLEAALDCPDFKDHIFLLGLHGGRGEDGTVQKWMEQRGIKFTGSNSDSCAKAFDKVLAKRIVADYDIKTPSTLLLLGRNKDTEERLTHLFALHHKIVVKPVSDGSSVGLCIVENDRGLEEALTLLQSQPRRAFVAEPFVSGVELTVGVIDDKNGPRALPCTEIRAQSGRVFDYNGKYLGEGVQEITPAEVSEDLAQKAQKAAVTAHKALGCLGYSRSDLIMNNDGAIFLETNTLPGLTRASLVPQQLAAAGLSLDTFIEQQLELAEKRDVKKPI